MDTSGTDSFSQAGGVVNDEWHHIALTYDSAEPFELKLYYDGSLLQEWNTPNGSLAASSTSPLSVGMARPGGSNWGDFEGYIDDLRVYTRDLSGPEIATLYNQEPTLDANTGLTLDKGTSSAITNTHLAASDSDSDPITYTVTDMVDYGTLWRDTTALVLNDTFTQADVDGGLLSYEHTNLTEFSDSFDFVISDGVPDGSPDIGDTTFAIAILDTDNHTVLLDTPIADQNEDEDNPFSLDVSGNFWDVNGTVVHDYNDFNVTSYGGSQDQGTYEIQDGGITLKISGNSWKKIDLNYTVTADTVLEFDFQSTHQGEIHGIGFDTDNNISAGWTFALWGTQTWGLQNFRNYGGSGWQHYVIDVGTYYTGAFSYLMFAGDDDATQDQDGFFRNVLVYEDTGPLPLTYMATKDDDTALPSWLSFDGNTGQFSGTPLNEDVGTIGVKVTATDGEGGSASDVFDLTVNNTNDAPTVANPISNQNATVDMPYAYAFAADTFSDVDVGDTLTYSATKSDDSPLPGWLSFDPGTREFSGTPGMGDLGIVSIKVTAEDTSLASTFDVFDLTVGSSLIAHWTFDDTSGSDETGSHNAAPVVNVTSVAGAINNAVDFNGGNSYMEIPDAADINLMSVYTRSFSLWFQADTTANRQLIFREGGATNGISLYIDSNRVYAGFWSGGAEITNTWISGAFSDTVNWHHLAFVFDSTTGVQKLFLDNVIVDTSNRTGYVPAHSGDIVIGYSDANFDYHDGESSSPYYFNGRLDDYRMYDVAIGDAAVEALYNQPPTDLALDNDTVNEATAGAAVGNLSAADVNVGDTHTYSIQSDPSGLFEIVGSQLKLIDGVSADYESATSHNITIRATDSSSLTYDEVVTITILDINENPTDIALSNDTIAENDPGANVGTLSASDPDAGDSHTFTIQSDPSGLFEVVGTQLKLQDGVSADYESATSYDVTIRTTDSGLLTYDELVTIQVTDVNEDPTDISLDNDTVDENAVAAVVGNLSTTDPDAGDTHTYSIINDPSGFFEIVGAQLKLKAGVSLDYEAVVSYNVTVRSTDGGGLTYDEVLTVNVNDINEDPTDISLSNDTIDENDAGAVVGTLSASDPDAGDSHTYSIQNDPSGMFEVVGTQLKLLDGVSADYESATSYTILLRVTDGGGLFYDELLTLQITNVNEVPTDLILTNDIVAENQAGAAIGTLIGVDPDAGDPQSYSLELDASGHFEVVGNLLKLRDGVALNYEDFLTYDVTIRTTDLGGLFYDELFTISVTNENETPIDITMTDDTVEENAAGDQVGILAAVDPDPGDSHTFAILIDPSGLFEIVVDEFKLRDGVSVDYEVQASYNLTLRVTDGGGLFCTKPITVLVTDVNEDPTDIVLSNDTIWENDSGAVVGDLSAVDEDIGDTHTFAVQNDPSGMFEVVGAQLKLLDGVSADYEMATSYDVTIRTTDSGFLTYDELVTIQITDVNEDPTDIALSNDTVAENDAGVIVGSLTTTDPDVGDSHTYTIQNDPSGLFEIVGSQFKLIDGLSADYEAASSHNITVRTTDGGGLTYDEIFTVQITDVNENPTDISLDNNAVAENAAGAGVGNLSASDPDAGDSHTYALQNDPSGLFEIVGNQLKLKAGCSLDYEVQASYTLTIRTTDSGGLTYDELMTVDVTDVNDSPTDISLTNDTIAENDSGVVVGDLSATDQDAGDTHTFSIQNDPSGMFEVVGAQLKLLDGVSANYEVATSYDLTIRATDVGGLPYDEVMTVHITNVNDAPTAGDETIVMDEDTSYPFTANDFNFADEDTSDSLVQIRITQLEGAGYLELSGVAVTLNQVILVGEIGDMTFTPAADAFGVGYADFQFQVHDGTEYSISSYTVTIDVNAVNDPPASADHTITMNEDTSYAFGLVDFSFGDVDPGDSLVQIQITQLEPAGDLELSGVDVTADQVIPAAQIANLTFTPAANANGIGYADFQFQVHDGTENSVSAYTMTIDVLGTNDPPTAVDNTVATEENEAYRFAPGDFGFQDDDAADALVRVQVCGLPGQGTLQLSGVDVVLDQEIEVAEIVGGNFRFAPELNENGLFYADFSFKVHDGTEYSLLDYTMTVDVLKVNEPPIADAGGPYAIWEGEVLFLDGTESSDPDGDVLRYYWDLDNNGNFDNAFDQVPEVEWSELAALGVTDGANPIGLWVIDAKSITDYATSVLSIMNLAPTADAGGPYEMVEGGTLILNALGSTDPGEDPLGYAWELDNDGSYDDAAGGLVTIDWATLYGLGIVDDGEYSIGVRVTDTEQMDDGAASSLTVHNAAPEIINVSANTPVSEDGIVIISGEISDPGQDSFVLHVDWGDGITGTLNLPETHTTFTLLHLYDDDNPPPFYNVLLTVFDDDGDSNFTNVNLLVNPYNDPPAVQEFEKHGTEDLPILFTAAEFYNAFEDPDEDELAFVRILSLPQHGVLTCTGQPVAAGAEIIASELDQLVFTPDDDWQGTTSLLWNASDGYLYASENAVLALTVAAVNDAPRIEDLQVSAETVSWGEVFTVSGFVSDVDGATTLLEFYLDVDNNGIFESALDTHLNADVQITPGDFSQEISTADFVLGPNRLFVLARDEQGLAGALEERIVQVVDTTEVTQGQDLTITNDQNQTLIVSLQGSGSAEVVYLEPQSSNLVLLRLVNPDEKTVLRITSPEPGPVILPGDIVCTGGSIRAIVAPDIILAGNVYLENSLRSISFAGFMGEQELVIGGGETESSKLKLKLGQVDTLHFVSQTPIKKLKTVHWLDGTLTAPGIQILKVTGDRKQDLDGVFGPDVSITSATTYPMLGKVKIAGDLIGGTWDIPGSVGVVRAETISNWNLNLTGENGALKQLQADSVGKLSENAPLGLGKLLISGSLSDARIHSLGDIGKIQVGAMHNSQLLVGVNSELSDLPSSADDFESQASIRQFRIGRSSHTGAMVDSAVAAWQIDQALLHLDSTPNGVNGSHLIADRISNYTRRQESGTVRLGNLDQPGTPDAEGTYRLTLL